MFALAVGPASSAASAYTAAEPLHPLDRRRRCCSQCSDSPHHTAPPIPTPMPPKPTPAPSP
ncbi:hypothetical protein PF005_g2 [Phytophthora fragariae]|uniref:Uncharacterized protein n=1 Tax=Phytophthora fragariae TaxID=53985 RepID=A0A6A3G106_9STRA|nr:hypothetical protein PF003_g5746 [Phytophthora fragariae]KAE8950431.1 hypothetical protein PF009_g2 [Phytophthora fragariae]KAE8986027.1 hypothetical protein PF011_g20158 [Phytophthora fragariae]KAE9121216.1 hypothetical protein PF010_g7184 [Phytophthora fragariae]KAE9141571.1 hypothetical protein PF007_g133 [Phytophthora fragariae]